MSELSRRPIDLAIVGRIAEIARVVSAEPRDVPDLAGRPDDAAPYGWQDESGELHVSICERGVVRDDRATRNADEFCFWLTEIMTTAVAQRAHPPTRPEDRRVVWAQQYRLLELVNPRWAQRWVDETSAMLRSIGATDDLALLPRP